MTIEDLKTYFSKAFYEDAPQDLGGSSSTYSFKNIHFSNPQESSFVVTYYQDMDTDVFIQSKQIKTTKKKTIVSISDSTYELAKKSL